MLLQSREIHKLAKKSWVSNDYSRFCYDHHNDNDYNYYQDGFNKDHYDDWRSFLNILLG